MTAKMARRATRDRWLRTRVARSSRELRALRLRAWWRWRLRGMAISPATLRPDEPLWRACFRMPRGWLVRDVAARMREDYPGQSLATDVMIEELLERVAARIAADPHAMTVPPRDVLESELAKATARTGKRAPSKAKTNAQRARKARRGRPAP